MKIREGGILEPKGYLAGAVHCGIKRLKKDLCLIYSNVPANAAGVFTSNKVKGAPLVLSRKNLKNGIAQAIIANSGNANCLTGKAGLLDAEKMASAAAKALSIRKGDVLVASTGVIGRRLPIDRICGAMDDLITCLGTSGSIDVAKTLMTTDTVPKETAVSFKIGSGTVNIGAVAKGAGMIHPDMATMLVFITTDADIASAALNNALKESVEDSFNCITVDGDTSTNDCVFVLANGLAKNKPIMSSGKNYESFKEALKYVSHVLAEKIVRDAEGATKFVKVVVKKAKNRADAKTVAYAVATSPLVKTAVCGGDPNWGRIAAAAGRSRAEFETEKLDLYIGGKKVIAHGAPKSADMNQLRHLFRQKDIEITLVLNKGNGEAAVLTSDLTKRYIDINAHYTT